MDALICHTHINGLTITFFVNILLIYRGYSTQFYLLAKDMGKRKHNVFLNVYNYSMCNQSTKIEHKLRNYSLINGKDFSIHPSEGT